MVVSTSASTLRYFSLKILKETHTLISKYVYVVFPLTSQWVISFRLLKTHVAIFCCKDIYNNLRGFSTVNWNTNKLFRQLTYPIVICCKFLFQRTHSKMIIMSNITSALQRDPIFFWSCLNKPKNLSIKVTQSSKTFLVYSVRFSIFEWLYCQIQRA